MSRESSEVTSNWSVQTELRKHHTSLFDFCLTKMICTAARFIDDRAEPNTSSFLDEGHVNSLCVKCLLEEGTLAFLGSRMDKAFVSGTR